MGVLRSVFFLKVSTKLVVIFYAQMRHRSAKSPLGQYITRPARAKSAADATGAQTHIQ